MARMYPDPMAVDVESEAEKLLYGLFKRQLGDGFIVMHGVPWILKNPGRNAKEGEADFVIVHARYGILVIEAKSGQVRVDGTTHEWNTIDGKDPFAQARNSKYALLKKIKEDTRTPDIWWPMAHAVAFPHVEFEHRNLKPDAPQEIVIDQRDLQNLQTKIASIFHYWNQVSDDSKELLSSSAIEALVAMLSPTRHIRTTLARRFQEAESEIRVLSERQFRTLDILSRQTEACIVGGAGTGKTLLAVEKACRLVAEGFEVLFVCFNANLAEWVGTAIKRDERVKSVRAQGTDEPIVATTFHSLCGKIIHQWNDGQETKAPKTTDEDLLFRTILPNQAIEVLSSGAMTRRFDAIIVDEGQDFEEDWWLVLDELRRVDDGGNRGVFYVFFDDNQRIYGRIKNLPINTPEFPLTENWRNTKTIHDMLSSYSKATYPTIPVRAEGPPIRYFTEEDQRKALRSIVHELVIDNDITPSDIVILTSRSKDNSSWHEGQRIGSVMLTWQLNSPLQQAIRVSTVHGFKGLESPVIVLTEMESAWSDEMVYVALSRAINYVVVIGTLPPPQSE